MSAQDDDNALPCIGYPLADTHWLNWLIRRAGLHPIPRAVLGASLVAMTRKIWPCLAFHITFCISASHCISAMGAFCLWFDIGIEAGCHSVTIGLLFQQCSPFAVVHITQTQQSIERLYSLYWVSTNIIQATEHHVCNDEHKGRAAVWERREGKYRVGERLGWNRDD